MTKIIIPERKVVQTFREFEVEEGELILLVNRHRVDEQGLVKSAIIGVFGGIIEEDNSRFRERWNTNRYYDKKYLKVLNSTELKPRQALQGLSNSQEYTTFWITKQLKQIYSPQEEVIKALQSWQGFEAHAEWVTKLRKPYVETA